MARGNFEGARRLSCSPCREGRNGKEMAVHRHRLGGSAQGAHVRAVRVAVGRASMVRGRGRERLHAWTLVCVACVVGTCKRVMLRVKQ